MKIAVLAWGSLIWDPGELKIKSSWFEDGPFLPIEFARISIDERLTLVIKRNSKPSQVLWSLVDFDDLAKAMENLRVREKMPNTDRVGFVNIKDESKQSKYAGIANVIFDWAIENSVDAVIWTDLGVRFKDKINKEFNSKNVISYLGNLQNDKLEKAKEYIIKAPKQIQTDLRLEIQEKLNWK